MEKLRQAFTGLEVSKNTLHDFTRKHCNLSLKKSQFQPVDKNSKEKIKEYLDWIRKWEKTSMDFTRNYVLLDESAFHINAKCSMV
jgi:small-conductance mechanosensitive channel